LEGAPAQGRRCRLTDPHRKIAPTWGVGRMRTVNCDHVDKVVTATASMKWMSSGLRAPV
jgi:hypothetical protein